MLSLKYPVFSNSALKKSYLQSKKIEWQVVTTRRAYLRSQLTRIHENGTKDVWPCTSCQRRHTLFTDHLCNISATLAFVQRKKEVKSEVKEYMRILMISAPTIMGLLLPPWQGSALGWQSDIRHRVQQEQEQGRKSNAPETTHQNSAYN
jgi:hypothetical protein